MVILTVSKAQDHKSRVRKILYTGEQNTIADRTQNHIQMASQTYTDPKVRIHFGTTIPCKPTAWIYSLLSDRLTGSIAQHHTSVGAACINGIVSPPQQRPMQSTGWGYRHKA